MHRRVWKGWSRVPPNSNPDSKSGLGGTTPRLLGEFLAYFKPSRINIKAERSNRFFRSLPGMSMAWHGTENP